MLSGETSGMRLCHMGMCVGCVRLEDPWSIAPKELDVHPRELVSARSITVN